MSRQRLLRLMAVSPMLMLIAFGALLTGCATPGSQVTLTRGDLLQLVTPVPGELKAPCPAPTLPAGKLDGAALAPVVVYYEADLGVCSGRKDQGVAHWEATNKALTDLDAKLAPKPGSHKWYDPRTW